MKIEHIAIWVKDIDKVCEFYAKYLKGTVKPAYHNQAKGFTSRFIVFGDGARLEVMNRNDICENVSTTPLGYAHIAMSLGSKKAVDSLTAQMASDGITIVGQPRTTGDGYYESVVEDPEGNLVELTV